MSKVISNIKRVVAIVDICCLAVLTILSFMEGVDIDIYAGFNVLICFLFSILLLKSSFYNGGEVRETNGKKKSMVYFLLVASVFLSVVEIYMFYEEVMRDRSGISCAIAAIATYTLFDSVHKYVIRNN
jgi:hypothetical protein